MATHICLECGKGTVRPETRHDIPATFEHISFVVPVGEVHVCDDCGAESYAGPELERWRALFYEHQARSGLLLSGEEIGAVRESLGLNITQFAQLLGSTRQSLSYWEKPDRSAPQGRMADLLLRLVRESAAHGPVDVLRFLQERARAQGVEIELPERDAAAAPSVPGDDDPGLQRAS